jgi:hypothetical protein
MPEDTAPERDMAFEDGVLSNGLPCELAMSFDFYWNCWLSYWSTRNPAEFELAQNVAKALIACTRDLATPEGAPWLADQLKGELAPELQRFWRLEALSGILEQGLSERARVDSEYREQLVEQKANDLANLANKRGFGGDFYDLLHEHFLASDNCALRITWESFVIELVGDAMKRVQAGSVRMIELAQLIVDANPPRRTLDYLRRISACFIWGFDPECIILCRSALDTAFREKVSDEICEEVFHATEERDFGLKTRILAAHRKGMISDGLRDTAVRIKDRGDKAVHYDPDATREVLGTVRDTVKVLKALWPS